MNGHSYIYLTCSFLRIRFFRGPVVRGTGKEISNFTVNRQPVDGCLAARRVSDKKVHISG